MTLKPHLAFNSKDSYVINMNTMAPDGYQNDIALSICCLVAEAPANMC
jgi:hypothetical protein